MSRKLLVGTVLLSGAILVAVFSLSSPKSVYARSISEFAAHPTYDEPARLYGVLAPGSLCRRDHPCEYRFRLADHGSQLAVHYPECILPDTFRVRPGIDLDVTVEGSMCANCHVFEAARIFVKTGGKYELKPMNAGGQSSNEPNIPMPVCSDP